MQLLRGGFVRLLGCLAFIGTLALPAFAEEEESSQRRIEEVVVYGEKIESTVSDTSISITAMSEDFLESMGIQGPNEMVNFIPATTRTDWDVKIRGVGRNFRGLGGDPGVGTYYNGIYSPDFGIAATEGAMYDIQRVEVLRGPQGTLYGRNSVGGVMNYVTNQPNHDEYEGSVRFIGGANARREVYGVVSGPITESFAWRFTGSKRKADGWMEGLGPAPDVEDTNDQNFAIILDWNVTENFSANLRFNDRRSLRMGNFGNGGHGILSEGPCIGMNNNIPSDPDQCDPAYRVGRDTNYYVPGLRNVDQAWADQYGAFPYADPFNPGQTILADYNREGVDEAAWPYSPNPNWNDPWVDEYGTLNGTTDPKPEFKSLTNGWVDEEFDHQTTALILDWDLNENLSFKYLGAYNWFEYWFDRDNDFSASELSSIGDTVVEGVWSLSHELRAFWNVGDRWNATSGIYYFTENREQHYAIRNRLAGGRYNNATQYGPDEAPTWVAGSADSAVGWATSCFDWMNAPLGTDGAGLYCGDPGRAHSKRNDIGAMYEHINEVTTDNLAIYTQGDFQISDKWSVTLGVRWSEDKREILEQRGGYSEIAGAAGNEAVRDAMPSTVTGINPAWFGTGSGASSGDPANPSACDLTGTCFQSTPGVTNLAAMNVGMGAASFNIDPGTGMPHLDYPITPTCDLSAEGDCANPLALGGLPISWGSRAQGKYKSDNWSYRINFNWEPTPDMLLYAGVTTSYRAGGFNAGGTDNRAVTDGGIALKSYLPEELTAWELGYKGTHFDGRVQLTGGIYFYDYKNYQDQVETWETTGGDFNLPPGAPQPGGRGAVDTVTNIPKSENVGAEADITWLATDNLTLGGNYSYTVSEWSEAFSIFNANDPRYPLDIMGVTPDQDPCTIEDPTVRALYCIQVDGRQLAGIPKHKGTFWGSYQWPMSPGTLSLYASVAFTGSYYSTALQRPWDNVPSRNRTDMRLTWVEARGRWEAHVFVDNVFNETYLRWSDMDGRRSGYGNFQQRTVALVPRLWGAEFTWNFGAMAR